MRPLLIRSCTQRHQVSHVSSGTSPFTSLSGRCQASFSFFLTFRFPLNSSCAPSARRHALTQSSGVSSVFNVHLQSTLERRSTVYLTVTLCSIMHCAGPLLHLDPLSPIVHWSCQWHIFDFLRFPAKRLFPKSDCVLHSLHLQFSLSDAFLASFHVRHSALGHVGSELAGWASFRQRHGWPSRDDETAEQGWVEESCI